MKRLLFIALATAVVLAICGMAKASINHECRFDQRQINRNQDVSPCFDPLWFQFGRDDLRPSNAWWFDFDQDDPRPSNPWWLDYDPDDLRYFDDGPLNHLIVQHADRKEL
jgi:hypothetical protein